MKIGRIVLGAAAALSLSLAGTVSLAGQSVAAGGLSVANVDQGQAAVVKIADGACQEGDSVVVDVASANVAKITKKGAAGTASLTFSGLAADVYTAKLTCVGYNGTTTQGGSATFAVWPTWLDITPNEWKAGDKITLTGYGFAPGETVSLSMISKDTSKSVWSDAAVAKADEDGVFTYSLVLKSDVPQGIYQLIATGDESGTKRIGEFGWGVDPNGTTPGGSSQPTAPATNPGLPSTGN